MSFHSRRQSRLLHCWQRFGWSQARYIDWFFTTPLLLLDVLLIAGTTFGTTLW